MKYGVREYRSQEQPKQYLFRCLFALTLMNLPLSIKPTSDATGVVCGHPGVLAGCRPVYSVRDCRKNNTPAPALASKRMLLVSTQDDSASVTSLPFVLLLPYAPLVVCRNVRITIFIFDVYWQRAICSLYSGRCHCRVVAQWSATCDNCRGHNSIYCSVSAAIADKWRTSRRIHARYFAFDSAVRYAN